jgi:phosphohistidine swiveling domain-containing protein
LESSLGEPQDIEFALKDDVIYLLQTRPITAVINQKSGAIKKNRIIWDNSNIIESYPGVTTPLTFSYILEAYKNVYMQIASIMGVSDANLKENEDTFGNMLGMVNGRVYYNLLSWYKVLSLFPGYELNARFMENMMGVKERFDLPQQRKTSKFSAFMRTSWMIIKIIGRLSSIKKDTREFQADVEKSVRRIKGLNMSELGAHELMMLWIDLDAELTPKWKAPLVNDSFAMYYFGKLQKTIEKYQISENKNLQNDLLCGSKDIISVEPIHRTIELATKINEQNALNKIFVDGSPQEIWTTLHEAQHAEIKAEIDRYIHDFGDRCVGELKLETISYTQDPSLFIAVLKSFVVQNITKSSTASTIDTDLRSAAEAEVSKALSGKFLKKRKLNKVLKKTRYFVSNRENLRYERTRVFGLSREIFTNIGREFEKNGVLNSHRDIFFLTKAEIFAFIQGTSVDKDLVALTNMRKIEYAQFEEMDLPAERFETFDAVNYGNDFFDVSKEDQLDGDLSGLGCCPGIVKAKVRVVKHPSEVDSMNGDILVTSSTDPGWVTLFPSASAIIVERGSLLSHSAIVSREMGIPCIVGVTGLLKRLKTGDVVEMDGSTGQIKLLDDE